MWTMRKEFNEPEPPLIAERSIQTSENFSNSNREIQQNYHKVDSPE